MEHGRLPRWYKQDEVVLPPLNLFEAEEFKFDLPFEDYLKINAVSNSGLKKVLKSPQHYLADLCGLAEQEESDAFRFGRAAHSLILEPQKFKELYVVAPKFVGLTKDGRESENSKEAKDKRNEWYASLDPNAQVVTQQEMDDLLYMVDSLVAHSQISNLLKKGRPEVTGLFNDEETGFKCKMRADYITEDGGIFLSDLKTSKDASIGLFSNDMNRFKYHMQLAFYADGIKRITGKEPEAIAIIACEKKPPYPCALYWVPEEAIEVGRQWYRYAISSLKRAIQNNDWPSIQSEGQMINLPKWHEYETYPQFDWKI